ncbi:MAG: hypothetical protein DRP74_03180 [Candidatus Omnitrophota bacterium]|nr:MAG: hypothetical protein DRP74_03180 [Candidatus Omnitrophota bacterium]
MLKDRGIFSYTSVELLLVIILIGVWVAVVLPRFNGGDLFKKAKLKTAAYNIVSDIRFVRNLAITNAKTYIIDFDFVQNEYRIYKESVAAENQVEETRIIPEVVSCSGENQLNFSSLGSVSFAADGVINLTSGRGQYRIMVIHATGSAYIENL